MSNHYTLIVIDVQYYFMAARSKSLQNNIIREIKKAAALSNPIVFVEYAGETIWGVRYAVENYPHAYEVAKMGVNGGREIHALLKHKGLCKTLRVCGVQTEACVFQTVSELFDIADYDITLVSSACGSVDESTHDDGIQFFNDLEVADGCNLYIEE